MQIFSLETIIHTIIVVIIFFTHFYRKVLCKFLSKIKIYLPFVKEDLELLRKLKSDKSTKQNAIVRTCEVEEYAEKFQEDTSYSELDLFFFFYVCGLTLLLFSSLVSFISSRLFTSDISSPYDFAAVLNFPNSFCYVLIAYIFIKRFKKLFRYGLLSKDFFIFCAFFASGLIFYYSIDYFNPIALGLKKSKIIRNIYDSLEKLNEKNSNSKPTSDNSVTNFSKGELYLNLFLGISFGLLFATFAIISMKVSSLDIFHMNRRSGAVESPSDYKVKAKIIINIFFLFALIDPLFKDLLPSKYSTAIYYSTIILVGLVEMSINLSLIWLDAVTLQNRNYVDAITFCETPSLGDLKVFQKLIQLTNQSFWEILLMLYTLALLPFGLSLFYFFNGSCFFSFMTRLLGQNLPTQNGPLELKENLCEVFSYITLLSILLSKGIILNGFVLFKGLLKGKII